MRVPLRKRRRYDRELILEMGLLVFAAGLAAGFGALLFGRTSGRARRTARRSENPPGLGSVPPERHQNVQTVAAR